MPTTSSYTYEARETIGEFVVRAGKAFLVIRASNVFGDKQVVRITAEDVAEFYETEATNMSSGIRSLAGLSGDWRPISELADLALSWFRQVNVEAMRRAAQRVGLEPRF